MKKLIVLLMVAFFSFSLFCEEQTFSLYGDFFETPKKKENNKKKNEPQKNTFLVEHNPNSTIIDATDGFGKATSMLNSKFTNTYQSFQQKEVEVVKKNSVPYNDNIFVHNGTGNENLLLKIYVYDEQINSWQFVDSLSFSHNDYIIKLSKPMNNKLGKYRILALEPENEERCFVSCFVDDHDLYISLASENQDALKAKINSCGFIYDNTRKNYDKVKDNVKIINNTSNDLTFSVFGAKAEGKEKIWIRIGEIDAAKVNKKSTLTSPFYENFFDGNLLMFSHFSVITHENENLNISAKVDNDDLIIEVN